MKQRVKNLGVFVVSPLLNMMLRSETEHPMKVRFYAIAGSVFSLILMISFYLSDNSISVFLLLLYGVIFTSNVVYLYKDYQNAAECYIE